MLPHGARCIHGNHVPPFRSSRFHPGYEIVGNLLFHRIGRKKGRKNMRPAANLFGYGIADGDLRMTKSAGDT